MSKFAGRVVFSSLMVAALLGRDAFAQNTSVTEAEAKMFAASAGYERFMGRWSQLLAPPFISFAGVKNGQRVLDVGTGTGSVAAAVEASMPSSEIFGIDPSQAFIAHAQKNAKSTRAQFEVGDAQALKFKDASFDQTLALLVMNGRHASSHGRFCSWMRADTSRVRPRGLPRSRSLSAWCSIASVSLASPSTGESVGMILLRSRSSTVAWMKRLFAVGQRIE